LTYLLATMNADFDKLTRFCLYRERCDFEVIQKMNELKIVESYREDYLAQLKHENYLNEERYIKAYVNAKIYVKKWGKKKIMAELSMRKVDKDIVKKTFLEVDDDVYIANLFHLAEKKWRTISKKGDREKQSAMYQFLGSKGYESDLIKDAIKHVQGINVSN
jgi:regulatory protein